MAISRKPSLFLVHNIPLFFTKPRHFLSKLSCFHVTDVWKNFLSYFFCCFYCILSCLLMPKIVTNYWQFSSLSKSYIYLDALPSNFPHKSNCPPSNGFNLDPKDTGSYYLYSEFCEHVFTVHTLFTSFQRTPLCLCICITLSAIIIINLDGKGENLFLIRIWVPFLMITNNSMLQLCTVKCDSCLVLYFVLWAQPQACRLVI